MHSFSEKLLIWFKKNGRQLPWRETADPYCIWISEIILQQTQVKQGYAYYLRFLERFPNVETLAYAEEDDVMQLWQGLGYYSRARNLHKAAKMIATMPSFPATYDEIKKLPGVGNYTSAAIASFAYNQPHAVVDGNVYRVLSRFFGISEPIDTTAGKRFFEKLANELLPESYSSAYNSAMMDFGALQCTPAKPNCLLCPLMDACVAYADGLLEKLPVKSKTLVRRTRYFVYLYIRTEKELLLHKRGAGDIWQGLYEPPLLEFDAEPAPADILSAVSSMSPGVSHTLKPLIHSYKHNLTHQQIVMSAYEMLVNESAMSALSSFIRCPLSKRDKYPHSRLVAEIYKATDRNNV